MAGEGKGALDLGVLFLQWRKGGIYDDNNEVRYRNGFYPPTARIVSAILYASLSSD